MNSILINGRETRDPEVRYSQGEKATAIANVGIAVNRKGKKDEVDFFDITAFGSTAEFLEKYTKKGTKLLVKGRLQNDTYTNKDGAKVSKVKIIAEEVEVEDWTTAIQKDGQTQNQTAAPAPAPAAPADDFMSVPDENELPF